MEPIIAVKQGVAHRRKTICLAAEQQIDITITVVIRPGHHTPSQRQQAGVEAREAAVTIVTIEIGTRAGIAGDIGEAGSHHIEIAIIVIVTPGHITPLRADQPGIEIHKAAVAIVAVDARERGGAVQRAVDQQIGVAIIVIVTPCRRAVGKCGEGRCSIRDKSAGRVGIEFSAPLAIDLRQVEEVEITVKVIVNPLRLCALGNRQPGRDISKVLFTLRRADRPDA